jgi:hypothetical protein
MFLTGWKPEPIAGKRQPQIPCGNDKQKEGNDKQKTGMTNKERGNDKQKTGMKKT